MTNYKKISFACILAMLFQLTNCAQDNGVDRTAFDILQEKYEHKIYTQEEIAPADAPDQDPIVTYSTKSHYFDTGLTRTKITTEITNGLRITTTEKWVTKHSSWATWSNLILESIIPITYSFIRKQLLASPILPNGRINILNENILDENILNENDEQKIWARQTAMRRLDRYYDQLIAFAHNRLLSKDATRTKLLRENLTAIANASLYAPPVIIAIFALYQYLSGQEKLNKEVVEKETRVLERELMALQAKELEVLAQEEPQL